MCARNMPLAEVHLYGLQGESLSDTYLSNALSKQEQKLQVELANLVIAQNILSAAR